MATVIVCGDARPATCKLLALAGVVIATHDARTVEDFAMSLRDIPTVEIWRGKTPTQQSYGPERKGRGGKVRRW